MKVTYTQRGASEPQVWDFRPDDIFETDAEMIERRWAKLIGEKSAAFDAWRLMVLQGQASARRVLLWHCQDRDHRGRIRIDNVNPRRGELVVEASKAELVDMRGVLEHAGMDEIQREVVLAQLDAQIAAAPEDDDQGKAAPSPTSDDVTG